MALCTFELVEDSSAGSESTEKSSTLSHSSLRGDGGVYIRVTGVDWRGDAGGVYMRIVGVDGCDEGESVIEYMLMTLFFFCVAGSDAAGSRDEQSVAQPLYSVVFGKLGCGYVDWTFSSHASFLLVKC